MNRGDDVMKKISALVMMLLIVACGAPAPVYKLGTVEKSQRIAYEIKSVGDQFEMVVKSNSSEEHLKVDVSAVLWNGEKKLKQDRLFVGRLWSGQEVRVEIKQTTGADKICVRYREGEPVSQRGDRAGYEYNGSFCVSLR